MFDLYFSMFDLSSGLKCEPGFGDLFRLAGDTSVSARQYHSRGVTGTRAKLQRSKLISGMQGWRARPAIRRRVNKTVPRCGAMRILE